MPSCTGVWIFQRRVLWPSSSMVHSAHCGIMSAPATAMYLTTAADGPSVKCEYAHAAMKAPKERA